MTNKLMSLFRTHLKFKHNITLYAYQEVIAIAVFEALLQNMRLTSGATEEDIKKLKRVEIPIEISRQAGKTTDIVAIIEFVIIFFSEMFKMSINTGVFAPQREQAKTDFDRLKAMLRVDSEFQVASDHETEEESNAKTIVLPNGSSCYVFPVTQTSKPESKTLHLIIIEESQDIDDKILKEQIWPMGSSTNAPIIYIGTAGTRICHFYRLGQLPGAIKLYFEDIVKQRREVFQKTGEVKHLIYEQNVRQLIEQYGLESDEIQRPYFGKWLIGTGQFVTQEALDALINPERTRRTFHDKENDCYAGIDTAKHPDSTVVTILRYNKQLKKKQILNWLELRGENYQNQYDIIQQFLSNYKVVALALDSTGQGDFMPDMFEVHSKWRDENTGLYRIKFSAVSKDNMYKNLKVSISELLTDLPKLDTREAGKFRQQMLDLQQEYKGQLLSVHHPDDPNGHDDYPDSWALAELAYAKYNENKVSLTFVGAEPERNLAKDNEGNVTDHWPGQDW